MFIENVGQFDAGAHFQVRGGHAVIHLADDAIWFTVLEQGSGVNLKVSFPGANSHPRLEPFDRLATHVSYFVGSDPAQWRADVPVWAGVRYVDLYPGVDLEVTSEGGRWAWRIVCRANWQFALHDVSLQVDGADALALAGDALRLSTARGEYTLPMLRVAGAPDAALPYPAIAGYQVAAPFLSSRGTPDLRLGPADLVYSTYLGGGDGDIGYAIAVDTSKNAYVTGMTGSTDFPTTTGAFSGTLRGTTDAFVTKVNPAGSGLVYSTFLGGSSDTDHGLGVAVDSAGNAYVTGVTWSDDFPTTAGAFSQTYSGEEDAYVVKLNPTGSALLYGTYLGGAGHDQGNAIAVPAVGANAYVTGYTQSTDFPMSANPYDTTYHGGPYTGDAFLVKLHLGGAGTNDLLYGTFLGGVDDDWGSGVAIDGAGHAYVAGAAWSDDFPHTTGPAYWLGYNPFAAKLNPANGGASDLVYSTFLGSGEGHDIAVDGAGNAYVAGGGQLDPAGDGPIGAFVAKLNTAGSALVYGTTLTGSDVQTGRGVAVDGSGNAYLTGDTNSTDLPVMTGAYQPTIGGSFDAFVAKLNASGGVAYCTFLGGSDADDGFGIALDGSNDVYVVGQTTSDPFPTTAGAFSRTYHGGPDGDAFVSKLHVAGYQLFLPLVLKNY